MLTLILPGKHAEAEAEALAEVFSESLDTRLATKADMARLEGKRTP